MKPVGLTDPATGKRPFAVVQLRPENHDRTLYNVVGFQTKMTYAAQERVFRMIPGLEHAVFERLGSIHRNSYIDGPLVLDGCSRLREYPHVFFAGQITGVEGYIESTASGLMAGIFAGLISCGVTPVPPPPATAMGALLKHTQDPPAKRYEPMNVTFGIMEPSPPRVSKKQRKEFLTERALRELRQWKETVERMWGAARV
jgi:methylenetetrahydrofolate--tRNA-(uracil-5-)-methyltransferase